MTAQPRRHHNQKPGPAGPSVSALGSASPEDDIPAAVGRVGQDSQSGRLAYSVEEAAHLTGLSRDLLYDEMRRGNLVYVKVGRRRLITRQHLQQFLGIAS
jgi:excisionase family DNA binding protein